MRGHPLLQALAAMTLLAGCATTIVPPADVREPVAIAILDHGWHASLLTQAADGAAVRYAYGDWRWFALGRTGVAEGVAALVGPTLAALGRRRYNKPFDPGTAASDFGLERENVIVLEVEASRQRRLLERLDGIFAASPAPPLENAEVDLEFVPHPEPYSLEHTSNRVVSDWLTELGCRIEGPGTWSSWRLAPARPT